MDIADPKVAPQPPSTDTTAVGSDRYRVHSTLGSGGMGIVYLAEDLKLHRQVAIKKLKDGVTSQNARDRIQQEARLLARLNHPNIVALYDVLEEQGNIALVMEYIEGTTLRLWMRERTPSLQQKLNLLMQICQGLSEAHNLGIIHRDLKPDNILITENTKGQPTAKITDFGIAKSQQLDDKTLTENNQIAGTVTAMSPEQVQGNPLDARSDLFSLGTIAFELLCGSRPFDKHEAGALAMATRIVSEPHTPPQQAWPQIPEPLAVLLDKLLAKDPTQRPQSALIVYQGFELLHKQGLESDSEEFTATLTDLFTRQKDKNRRRWQRALAGVAAALILGAGSYWGWKEFTRLEPQYIAVMPVEINGEIRGEENAKALTRTMVRQALMNSVSQLKASALVSFTPKEGQDFDGQLQALKDKGVTDALIARLDCVQARCEIKLQRLNPANSYIQHQSRLTFLTDKHQDAEYQITNHGVGLFQSNYHRGDTKQKLLLQADYEDYLNILSKSDSNAAQREDLAKLKALIAKYPENSNLYLLYAEAATDFYLANNDAQLLTDALGILASTNENLISNTDILEAKLLIKSMGNDTKGFESVLSNLQEKGYPSAHLLAQRARFFFTQGKYSQGLKYAKEAAALNPSADNLYLIALNQISRGNYIDARVTLRDTISNYPKHWSSYSALGVIELESGNYSAAVNAITSIPAHLRGWRTKSNLGIAYFLQGKYSAALKLQKQIAEILPNSIETTEELAATYIMLGDVESSKRQHLKLLELTEKKANNEEKRYRAIALANLGRKSEAIALTHEVIEASPEDTYALHSASQVYALSKEWASANYYIEKLIQRGMDANWFNLPAFNELCVQPQVTEVVKSFICK